MRSTPANATIFDRPAPLLSTAVNTAELEGLEADLQAGEEPVIVFAHQRLGVDGNHGVRNGAAVRHALESCGRVQAVFQGHSHANDLEEIGGIDYCTLAAMVEGSGVEPNGTLWLTGFRQQTGHQWMRRG